jgi:hypothetical protein
VGVISCAKQRGVVNLIENFESRRLLSAALDKGIVTGQGVNDEPTGGPGSDSFFASEKDAGFVLDFRSGVDVLM